MLVEIFVDHYLSPYSLFIKLQPCHVRGTVSGKRNIIENRDIRGFYFLKLPV